MRKSISLIAAILLLLPVLALAADKATTTSKPETKSFTLNDSVQMGSVQLAPGDYKVSFNSTGNNVPVTILKGKKTVATLQANIVPAQNNALGVGLQDNSSGKKELTEIELPNLTVKFTGATAQPAGASQ